MILLWLSNIVIVDDSVDIIVLEADLREAFDAVDFNPKEAANNV